MSRLASLARRLTFTLVIFSASTTHALRAVTWLARRGGDEPVMGRELASKLQLPPDYLAKILGTLARHGVLRATRGVRGGYRLARTPDRIRIIDVIQPFEGKRTVPGCLLRPERQCRDCSGCGAHGAWAQARDAYVDFIEHRTLADIQHEA